MMVETVVQGQCEKGIALCPCAYTTGSGVEKAPNPIVSHECGTGIEVWPLSQFSGNRRLANAGSRKAKGIHDLPDRACAQPERVTCNW